MLPFLKKKDTPGAAGVIIKRRQPDEKPEGEDSQDDKDAAIHAASQDLISAIQSNDVKGVSEAIRSAFEILDSMPHEEGEHVEKHSYDDQNLKAGINE